MQKTFGKNIISTDDSNTILEELNSKTALVQKKKELATNFGGQGHASQKYTSINC